MSSSELYGAKWTVLIETGFLAAPGREVDSVESTENGKIDEEDVKVCVFAMPMMRSDV